MKNIIALIFIALLSAPAIAAPQNLPSVPEKSRAEQQALAEFVTARLKAALDGEAYTIDGACPAQKDCVVTLSRSE